LIYLRSVTDAAEKRVHKMGLSVRSHDDRLFGLISLARSRKALSFGSDIDSSKP
jgi:hypothetical protein